ncbi:MAG: insulinase family protein, partial [Burkholderiales bacterium]
MTRLLLKAQRALRWAFCLGAVLITTTTASAAITQWVTPYGTQVVFLAAKEIPMVDVSIDLDAGSRWDPEGRSGLASMTLAMLAKGVAAQSGQPALSETAISEAFAELAAQRGGSVSLDRATITLRALADREVRQSAAMLVSR